MFKYTFIVVVMVLACGLSPVAFGRAADDKAAADKSMEDQYTMLATARTKAELAVRKASAVFHDGDDAWRRASQACDAAYTSLENALQKAIETENARPEDQRDQPSIERYNTTRNTVNEEWQRFANVTRPSIEAAFRDAANSTNQANELLQNLAGLERQWKDLKGDLTPLAAMYDAVAKKADETREAGEKALGDVAAAQKSWEDRLEGAKPAGAKVGG